MKQEYDYIKRTYGLSFARGETVSHTVTRRSGIVRQEDKSQGHYVQVRFDGDRHNLPCHPEELQHAT